MLLAKSLVVLTALWGAIAQAQPNALAGLTTLCAARSQTSVFGGESVTPFAMSLRGAARLSPLKSRPSVNTTGIFALRYGFKVCGIDASSISAEVVNGEVWGNVPDKPRKADPVGSSVAHIRRENSITFVGRATAPNPTTRFGVNVYAAEEAASAGDGNGYVVSELEAGNFFDIHNALSTKVKRQLKRGAGVESRWSDDDQSSIALLHFNRFAFV
jgi:hypothetical protein